MHIKECVGYYDEGGLNLVNIETKNVALKVKWVQEARFKDETLWTQFVREHIPLNIDIFVKCNINKKDVKKVFHNETLQSVFTAWAEINFARPNSHEEVMNQVIWLNSCVKVRGDMLCNKKMINKGIFYVNQLIKEERYKTLHEIQYEYGRDINMLEWYGLIKAIPKEWIRCIKHKIMGGDKKLGINLVKDITKCTGIVYNFLRGKDKDDGKTRNRWERELEIEVGDKKWAQMYKDTCKTDSCNKT